MQLRMRRLVARISESYLPGEQLQIVTEKSAATSGKISAFPALKSSFVSYSLARNLSFNISAQAPEEEPT
jgi:hypothetical protein